MTKTKYTCPFNNCPKAYDDRKEVRRHMKDCQKKPTRKMMIQKELQEMTALTEEMKAVPDDMMAVNEAAKIEELDDTEVVSDDTNSESCSSTEYIECKFRVGKLARKSIQKRLRSELRKKNHKKRPIDLSHDP